jgi:hypothetical protein
LVVGGTIIGEGIGIGTTAINYADAEVYGNVLISPRSDDSTTSIVTLTSSNVYLDDLSIVGLGTTAALGAVDFSCAGYGIPGKIASFMIVPRVTTAERVGLITQIGAVIFNLTTSKFQGYTGTSWFDFH